jgi:hypothetical protein
MMNPNDWIRSLLIIVLVLLSPANSEYEVPMKKAIPPKLDPIPYVRLGLVVKNSIKLPCFLRRSHRHANFWCLVFVLHSVQPS